MQLNSSVSFTLPLPPPTNQTYRAVYSSRLKRTVFFSSYESKKWKALAQKTMLQKDIIDTPVKVEVQYFFKRERDIDSGLKLLLDALQGTVIKNDSQVKSLLIIKGKDVESPHAVITIHA